MLKMFIVDDEDMEREGIRSLYAWEELGLSVIGEAWNGQSALEALTDIEPDLVITDVRMPGMNGLEFAARLKKRYANVKFIFISGYEDFDAARNAVDVNAIAYLMKPINKDALIRTIEEAIGRITEEKHREEEGIRLKHQVEASLPVLREQFLRDMLLGIDKADGDRTIQQARTYGLALPAGKTAVMVVKLEASAAQAEQNDPDQPHMKAIQVYRQLSQIIKAETPLPPVMTREGEYTVLIPCSSMMAPEDMEEHLETTAESWIAQISKATGLTLTIGLALAEDGMSSVHPCYRKARMAVNRKFYLGARNVLWYVEDEEAQEEITVVVHRMKEELADAVLMSELDKIKSIVMSCFQGKQMKREQAWFVAADLINTALQTMSEKKNLLKSVFEQAGTPWENMMRKETIDALAVWVVSYIERIAELARTHRGSKNEQVVHTIKQCVQDEYMLDLSVEYIAGKVFLAPGYVRKLFKNETGVTLKDYIVQTRMKKACELLRRPELKVNEVAHAVGYENVSYFCSVFKNFYGTTPGEFKDAYQILA